MKQETTNKQLEIERLDENHENNYRIVWGNPLNSNIDKEIKVNILSINGFGTATKYMQISQYRKEITIEYNDSKANIVLE